MYVSAIIAAAYDENLITRSHPAASSLGEFSGVVANIAIRSGSNHISGLFEHRLVRPNWVGDNTGGLAETLRVRFRPQKILSRS